MIPKKFRAIYDGKIIKNVSVNTDGFYYHFLPEVNRPGILTLPAYYEPLQVQQFVGEYDSTEWYELTDIEQKEWLSLGKTAKEWPGKEIYERDILKIPEWKGTFEVRYEEGRFYLGLKSGNFGADLYYINRDGMPISKIIGNTELNPELLITED